MKEILHYLFNHNTLSEERSYDILKSITEGKYNDIQTASFLTVFQMRDITEAEMKGFRKALWELCIPMDVEGQETICVCGTGGDGKNTFNISTLSAFLVAGAGYKVTKHGNYAVSSNCGSSNVLEALGYQFTNNTDQLKTELEQANICFLHAPFFHPAMKQVAPTRKQLKVKTFFNMLGPLINPARPTHQFAGVFNLKTLRLFSYLLEESKTTYSVVHSLDGYDEISLTSPFRIVQNKGATNITPEEIGFKTLSSNLIHGADDIKTNADLFLKILKNEGTEAQSQVVIANATMAIKTMEEKLSIEDCIAKATDSLVSGKAFTSLKKIIS